MRTQKRNLAVLNHIISGGQTGVDRAALDAAMRLGVRCAGWCPRGRLAEDGRLPLVYPLSETDSSDYAVRTEWNVRDADATLVLAYGPPAGGTAYTMACARKHGKPALVQDLSRGARVAPVRAWLKENRVRSLNVAGPRASAAPGVYGLAREFMETLLSESAPCVQAALLPADEIGVELEA